jgi:magnesium chelatase family protein
MRANVKSCAVIGLDGVVVDVEVDTRSGLPAVVVVGLPDAAVQESRERVQSTSRNANLPYPRNRIIVNLAPTSIRKEGPLNDLPIAVGILVAAEAIRPESHEGAVLADELSLDGSLRHISGALPIADLVGDGHITPPHLADALQYRAKQD